MSSSRQQYAGRNPQAPDERELQVKAAEAFALAAHMLASKNGRGALKRIGCEAVKQWRDKSFYAFSGVYDDGKMDRWIQYFIADIGRHGAGMVTLSESGVRRNLEQIDGQRFRLRQFRFEPRDEQRFKPNEWYKRVMKAKEDWHAIESGEIVLDRDVISKIVGTKKSNPETSERLFFYTAVTIAFQLIHCFLGFLAGPSSTLRLVDAHHRLLVDVDYWATYFLYGVFRGTIVILDDPSRECNLWLKWSERGPGYERGNEPGGDVKMEQISQESITGYVKGASFDTVVFVKMRS
ncbi:hypothetical protein VTK56DRAFT_4611 [Thermocarpiscus australiensis]